MLGFSPIAASPVADVGYSIAVTLTAQTLSPSLNSVSFLTNNAVPVTSVTGAFTLNEESIQADSAKIILLNLPALLTHLGHDEITADSNFTPDNISLSATLNSPDYAVNNYIPVTGQALNATLNSASIQNGHTINVTGMEMNLTLKSMRMWYKISTAQTPNWTRIPT